MPQIDIKLQSTADMSGVQRMQAGINQLGQTVQKKLEIQDVGKSFLNGLGLGSGFAVAEQAFTRWAAIFNEIGEGVKAVSEYVEVIGKRADEISKMRFDNFLGGLNPDRQLAALTGKLSDLDQKLEALQVKKNALYADLKTAGETPRGTISGSAFDPFGGRYGEFGTMKGVGDQIDAAITKNEEELDARTKDRLELQKQIAATQKTIADAKKKEVDDAAKASDQLDDAVNKSAIAEAQAIEEAKAKSEASGAEILAQRKKTDETNAATTAIRTAQDAVEKYDTALARLDANPYLSDQEKQGERLRILKDQTKAIEAQKKALDEFSAKYPGVDVGGLTSARDRLADKATANSAEQYKTANRETLAANDQKALRDMGIGSAVDENGKSTHQRAVIDETKHYATTAGGVAGGASGFLTSLGTAADAAAQAVNTGLNAALSTTSDWLYNLASGAMTFHDAWQSAVRSIGQQFLRMATDMVAKMIWRSTVERALIKLGVIEHVGGEQLKTGSTLAGAAIRLGTIIKEALADVYHGAVAAFKALAGIPYVGPILGGAAMAAALAGGIALVSKIGHADGAIIRGPGGATDDLIPAMLSNGEAVTRAHSVAKFGEPFFNDLNAGVLNLGALPASIASQAIRSPGASSSGYSGGGGGSSSGSGGGRPLQIALIDSRDRNGRERIERNPHNESVIIEVVKANRSQLGIKI